MVTFKPLSLGIINYVDSNSENFGQKVSRFLNYDFNSDKAIVYIVTTDTETELGWIDKALKFLDPSKIKWMGLGSVEKIA